MICKVRETALKYSMFRAGGRVAVALSGGADSMSLLHCLIELKDEFGIELCAAHVNHCLRGEESERDEAFVRRECERLGVKLFVLRADVAAEAKKSGEGLEEAGRRIRYSFFDSLGDGVTVATAHNLNDRAETFLFNFARGAGLNGLCSVPPVRGNIVRPLICCSREEIEAFCESRGIEYVTDSSNLSDDYSRNKIRHRIIPELKELNPSFEAAAERCIESLNDDESFLRSLAGELVESAETGGGFNAAVLASAPGPVKSRALSLIISRSLGVKADSGSVARLAEILNGGATQITGGAAARVRKGVLEFPEPDSEPIAETVLADGVNIIGADEIEAVRINSKYTNKLQNSHTKVLEYFFDCDKISGNVVVRAKKDGDRFSPAGRNCTKTLKKLFNEASVPPEKRGGIYVFSDEAGIIAVEGFGVDKRCAVTAETKNLYSLKIRRGK